MQQIRNRFLHFKIDKYVSGSIYFTRKQTQEHQYTNQVMQLCHNMKLKTFIKYNVETSQQSTSIILHIAQTILPNPYILPTSLMSVFFTNHLAPSVVNPTQLESYSLLNISRLKLCHRLNNVTIFTHRRMQKTDRIELSK